MIQILFLFVALCTTAGATTTSPILNIDGMRKGLGLYYLYPQKNLVQKRVKVAVIDNFFQGYQGEIGQTLPKDTVFHPMTKPLSGVPDSHGLLMAQIVNSLMTDQGRALHFEPELHLFQGFGYTNFKAAVEKAIALNVDIILYSQVWDYIGMGRGEKNFINQIVSKATKAGILWINSSSNLEGQTYRGGVQADSEDWLNMPGPGNSLRFDCFDFSQEDEDKKPSCDIRIALSWSDFKKDDRAGSSKDLKLVVSDESTGQETTVLLEEDRTQVVSLPKQKTEGVKYSLYPREILYGKLTPGRYHIKVKDQSRNFSDSDEFKVTLNGDFNERGEAKVVLVDRNSGVESLAAPSDHPQVLTVGASETMATGLSQSLAKPEVSVPSQVFLKNGYMSDGSSNSAAMVAAAVGVLKTIKPELQREDLDSYIEYGEGTPLDLWGVYHHASPISMVYKTFRVRY
jgi:hypothetical protein